MGVHGHEALLVLSLALSACGSRPAGDPEPPRPAAPVRPLRAAVPPPPAIWAQASGTDEPGPLPRCFAYSPSRRSYACLGWVAPEEEDDPLGYVDIVGGTASAPIVEAHQAWSRRKGEMARPAITRRLSELGFVADDLKTARLPSGAWVTVDATAIRYQLRLHEGDASYEYFGDVSVRCADGGTHTIDVRKRGLELGELAAVSWAPDTETMAVSVHGVDGGEGHDDHWINTVVIDTAALCEGVDGIIGPIEGRMVGP